MSGFSSLIAGLPISAFAMLIGILVPCLAVSLYLSVHRSRILFTGAALWITVEILRTAMMLNTALGGASNANAAYPFDFAVTAMLASFMVVMLVAPQVVVSSRAVTQARIVLYCRLQAAGYAIALITCVVSGIEPILAPFVSGWCLINAVLIVAAGLWRASRTRNINRLIALCWAFGFGLTSTMLIVRQEPALSLIMSGDPLWIGASVARLLFVACGVLLIGLQDSVRDEASVGVAPPGVKPVPALTPTALGVGVPITDNRLVPQGHRLTSTDDYAYRFESNGPYPANEGAAVAGAQTGGSYPGAAALVSPEHQRSDAQTIANLTAQLDAARTQLSDAADLQRQISSLLSHELRAPLSTISAAAQSLDLILSGSGELVDGRIARIRRSVMRMTELLDAFFSAERTHSGPLSPIYQAVDLSVLAASVIAQQQPDASHTLVLDAPAPVIAWCDPSLCAVVLRNLTHNAIKYSPANRPIVVRVRAQRSGDLHFGVISVTDQGTGMDAEEMTRIFERNYRRASHREVKGTGIGLYLARKLCEHQSGKLEVDSTVGTGSVFVITLPGNRPTDS